MGLFEEWFSDIDSTRPRLPSHEKISMGSLKNVSSANPPLKTL